MENSNHPFKKEFFKSNAQIQYNPKTHYFDTYTRRNDGRKISKPLSSVIKWAKFLQEPNLCMHSKDTTIHITQWSWNQAKEASWTLYGMTVCAVHSVHAVCLEPRPCIWVMQHRWVLPDIPGHCMFEFKFIFWSLMLRNLFIDAKFSIASTNSLYQPPMGVMLHSLISWDVVQTMSWWFSILVQFPWVERFHECCGSGHLGLTTIHPVALCAWHSVNPVSCGSGPCSQGYQAQDIVAQFQSHLHQVWIISCGHREGNSIQTVSKVYWGWLLGEFDTWLFFLKSSLQPMLESS